MAGRTGMNVRRTSEDGRFPLVIAVRPASVGTVLAAGISILLFIVAARFAQDLGAPAGEGVIFLAVVAATGLGAIWSCWKVIRSFRQRTDIRIDDGEVSVTERTLLGTRHWSEPLSAFEGVRWQRYQHTQSSSDSDTSNRIRHTHLIELVHSNPSKTIPLFEEVTSPPGLLQVGSLMREAVTEGPPSEEQKARLREKAQEMRRTTRAGEPRLVWEGYARQLDMPAIDARDGGYEVREAEDVDKNVQELAKGGRIDAAQSDAPPPPSLEVETLGDPADPASQELRVRLHATEVPLLFHGLFVAVGSLFVLQGVFTLSFDTILFGLVFIGIAIGIWYLERRAPREIRITREEIAYVVPNVESRGYSVPLSEVESVRVGIRQGATVAGRSTPLFGRELVLSTDRGEHTLAGGVPQDALEWLRRYIVSAIAHA
ncbi:hypothetical protein [Tranquillimonas alkanivorans]|uniref:Uncharacterized protein n=1 Tax=Tranquillimonas alkanivorans TaxID=441119 RepID=A0A1I5SWI3_9RHOB|nr:hypothetical protein [Tranquillimonas alkanivorans]SFP75021.1 hypothetical protein SAMN04488047_11222 [Tranquillimonas alkanivorans]